MSPRTLLLVPLLLLPSALAADTIRLKNGAVLHGTVIEEIASSEGSPAAIVVRIGASGKTRLAAADVAGWDRDDSGAAVAAAPTPAGADTAQAGVTPAAGGERIATTHIARLKSGLAVRGDLIEGETPDSVTLRIGSLGTVAFPRADVIELVAEAGTLVLPAPAPARPPEPPPAPEPAPTLEEIVAEIAAEVVARLYEESGRAAAIAIEPEEEAEIAEAASELTRQRNTNRVRAEETLRYYGPAALPYLRPLTNHPFDLTRRAVQRLVRDAGAWEGGPLAIAGLADPDPYVSEAAEEAILEILGPEVDEDLAGIGADEAWQLWLDIEARRLADILAETLKEFLAEETELAPESTAAAAR